jgi:DNA-directed RNA polymerase specialized sigma subunit
VTAHARPIKSAWPLFAQQRSIAISHELELPEDSIEIILERVHESILNLKPRYQEVIRLALYEGLPSTEIQKRMKITSSAYLRKLKCEATKALREELSKLQIQMGACRTGKD